MIVACYELWVSTKDDGWLDATLIEVEEDGQQAVIATRSFAPPVSPNAVSRWIRENTDLTRAGVLVLR